MKNFVLLRVAAVCAAAYLTCGFVAQAQDSYRSVPGLVGWYQLNQPGDTIINHVDGMQCINYGTTWVKGYYGNGRNFDGVDDWITCGNIFDLSGGDFTIAVWIYPRSDDYGMIVNKGAYYHIVGSYYLANTPTGVRFVISDGAGPGWYGIEGTNAPLALNTWQHIAATFHRTGTGSQLSLYVNGQLWDTAFTPRDIQHSSANFEIGAYFHPDFGHTFWNFNGVMDELVLFDRSLSQNEIQHVAGPIRGDRHYK